MSAITVDGEIVHYETMGRGKPILFLHGWLGSWRYWMPIMQEVSDQYRTYALDLWGFGDSGKVEARYSIAAYGELIEGFISRLGLDEVVIVGHALGAIAMLDYATHQPNRIAKLLAISLPLYAECVNHRLLTTPQQSLWSKLLWWQFLSAPESVQSEIEKRDTQAVTQSLHSFTQIDLSRNLELIGRLNEAPILLIHGEKDNVVRPSPPTCFNHRWPNVRAIGMAETNHFPMLEEKAKFVRLFRDFLELEGHLSTLALKEEWWQRRMR